MRLLLILLCFLHPTADPAVYVCTGPYAARYHSVASCRGLNACKGRIIRETLSEAQGAGRTACHLCAGSIVTPARAGTAPASDGQCHATTKKGTRCSRAARRGGYCWQHGG
ncbi:DUF5763 domain-containing protein [Flaviaesturariibacter terrae]